MLCMHLDHFMADILLYFWLNRNTARVDYMKIHMYLSSVT